jgi:hypothetical protein
MSSYPPQHQQKEEDVVDLASFVSPLVDAISQLILCAVGESRAELTTHVQNVASFTNKVVLAAKEIALQSHDRDIQRSITLAINKVSPWCGVLLGSPSSCLDCATHTQSGHFLQAPSCAAFPLASCLAALFRDAVSWSITLTLCCFSISLLLWFVSSFFFLDRSLSSSALSSSSSLSLSGTLS